MTADETPAVPPAPSDPEAMRRHYVHEMRNSLGAIRTAAELLQRRLPEDPRFARLLEILLKEAERLDQLIGEAFPRKKP
jgi:signal transduction histidine kinase